MKFNQFILSLALMTAATLMSRESVASNDIPAECDGVQSTYFYYNAWRGEHALGLMFHSEGHLLKVSTSHGVYTVNLDSGGIILRAEGKKERYGTDRYNLMFRKTVFEKLQAELLTFREEMEEKFSKGISRLPLGLLEDPIPVHDRAYYGFPALDCADAMLGYLVHHFPGKYPAR